MDLIHSLAASSVASQKSSAFNGLLELDERVYIGMTVTFDFLELIELMLYRCALK
jgi:hypothetical protein